jgi:hypothetical protein
VPTLGQAAAAVSQGAQQAWLRAYAVNTAKRVAQKYGLDPNRMAQTYVRLIDQESGFDPEAYNSSSGASGIAQIMPEWHPNAKPWDPIAALDYGADYLGSMISRYGGDFLRGTAAYNYGPGSVDRLAGLDNQNFVLNLPTETQTYVKNILGITLPDTGGGMPRPPRQSPGDESEDPFGDGTGGSDFEDPYTYREGADGSVIVIDRRTGKEVRRIGGQSPWDVYSALAEEARKNRSQRAEEALGFGNLGLRGEELGLERELGFGRLGLDQQELAYAQERDALNRQLQAIEEARMQQTLAEQTRQNQRDTLIAAGPQMTAGREFYGGFEPGGAASGVANFAGVGFTPRSTAQSQVPLNVDAGPAQANPQLMALLDRYLNGG